MRAARLNAGRTDLIVEELQDPVLPQGCALVRIESVFVSPYMASLVDGTGGFVTPPRPFTPGMDAIGTVAAVAEDLRCLNLGDAVYCDSYLSATTVDGKQEYAFAGCFAISSGSQPLLAQWPDGALASHMVLPAECLTSVRPALEKTSADTLCRLGWLATAHSAFDKTGFRAGDSVAVMGATGLLGVSTLLMALALGASRVVAVGRSSDRLAAFRDLDPRIEISTSPPGDDNPVDLAVIAASDADAGLLESALPGIKRHGSMVILASPKEAISLNGLVTKDLSLRGSLWFPRDTPERLVSMISSGALDLNPIRSICFSLEEVNEAMAHAQSGTMPFQQVVVRP